MPTPQDALLVLQEFAGFSSAPMLLGNHGGFSGAGLWRVDGVAGSWCLRVWPERGPGPAELNGIHQLMENATRAGLPFVPTIARSRQGATFVERAGRFWEVTAWLPGQADFHVTPTPTRLAAACTAVAELHQVWAKAASHAVPCPAVRRRLEVLQQWQALIASGWRPAFRAEGKDPVQPWAERAWRLLPPLLAQVPDLLAPWYDPVVTTQPCLCDLWHDHVLFEGERVTGIVDYGSIKLDHVAVDLARLLGSMAGDDEQLRAAGIAAYRRLRKLSDEEERLVNVLDRTGTVLGVANWLRWLYFECRSYADRNSVAKRLAALVQRMESWNQPL